MPKGGQFIHVSQFYETILCFSILALIGQRIIMTIRGLDQKYLEARATQFDDQIDWQQSFKKQKQFIETQEQQQRRRQQQRKRVQQERKRLQQQRFKQQEAPKQQTLKTSLVENEHQTTDRKLAQSEQPTNRAVRKSLTDLRRSSQKLDKQVQIVEQVKSGERRPSSISNKQKRKSLQEQRNKTINLSQFQNADIKTQQQPSINPQENQQERIIRQQKQKQNIRYFIRIDGIFNEYIPILMCTLTVGMLCGSTYIFTMVCFFGYIFCSLLFNYANLLSKLKSQPTEASILSRINKLISGLFIIALFLNYWFDNQFGL